MLLPKKILQNLPPTSTNIHCQSLIAKYKNPIIVLESLCLAEFVWSMIPKNENVINKTKLYVGVFFNV